MTFPASRPEADTPDARDLPVAEGDGPALDARLARLLCARLCHDLGGAVGTLSGTLDMVQDAASELLEVSRDTATALRHRVRLYSAAWGGQVAACDAAAIGTMLGAGPASPRVQYGLEGLAPGAMVGAPLVPLVLNAALLGAEALPRGGLVTLSGSDAEGFLVLPQGRDAAWPETLLQLLAGEPADALMQAGPRRVLAPLLGALVAEAGWSLSLAFGPGGGVPPLVLAPG